MNELDGCVFTALRLIAEESGQDMIEYGLIVGAMGLGAIVLLNGLATTIANFFAGAGTIMNGSF
jgi:Flp pilus assembly pilin Flp